ncbi:MAG: hypothetical protein L6R42_006786, partial [Xanthoria sp. 1 TBL-2021]
EMDLELEQSVNQNPAPSTSDTEYQPTKRNTPEPLEETIPSLSMAPGDLSNPASEDSAQAATTVSSDSNASETSNASLQTCFGMVIHIPNEPSANRLCSLDTGADVNAISQEAIENLALKTESYRGGRINTIGPAFIPERQVTFVWHVYGFHKTYESTFVVLDGISSDEFDTMIGCHAVQKIGFYKEIREIWWSSAARDDEGPSSGKRQSPL